MRPYYPYSVVVLILLHLAPSTMQYSSACARRHFLCAASGFCTLLTSSPAAAAAPALSSLPLPYEGLTRSEILETFNNVDVYGLVDVEEGSLLKGTGVFCTRLGAEAAILSARGRYGKKKIQLADAPFGDVFFALSSPGSAYAFSVDPQGEVSRQRGMRGRGP